MLGNECYGDTYNIKDIDTGETLRVHVAKRADINLLMHLMAFRIFKSIIVSDDFEILSATPDRTTSRFYETKSGMSAIYKPKAVIPPKPKCTKIKHLQGCKCVKKNPNTKHKKRR